MTPDLAWPRPVPPRPAIARQHCRHYSYAMGGPTARGRGPTCALGLDLSAPAAALPCMPPDSQRGASCQSREDWTADERATWEAWRRESMQRLVLVMAAIPKDLASGNLDCPACGTGTVRWARASGNGHLHAACSTPFCVSIIQ